MAKYKNSASNQRDNKNSKQIMNISFRINASNNNALLGTTRQRKREREIREKQKRQTRYICIHGVLHISFVYFNKCLHL